MFFKIQLCISAYKDVAKNNYAAVAMMYPSWKLDILSPKFNISVSDIRKVEMKICSTIALALFFSFAANATAQLSSSGFINHDMKTCYGKLNELKKFNPPEYYTLNKKLMPIVQTQASLNGSQQYASQETMAYIKSLQTQNIQNTCIQIGEKLDAEMLKKAVKSFSY